MRYPVILCFCYIFCCIITNTITVLIIIVNFTIIIIIIIIIIITAAALRLGAPLCHPHKCNLCGHDVDQYATHGLSCQRSVGRHFRHAVINNIIQHSLAAANIPSRLEPSGLARSDGKRPDGITISPWEKGRTLIWDATCVDTLLLPMWIWPTKVRAQ